MSQATQFNREATTTPSDSQVSVVRLRNGQRRQRGEKVNPGAVRDVIHLMDTPVMGDVQIDWDGTADNCTFEVRDGDGSLVPVRRLDVHGENDVVLLGDTTVALRFERGPHHPGTKFYVKAVPIVWKSHITEASFNEPGFVARRGTDYSYPGNLTKDDISYVPSVLSGETQTAVLATNSGYCEIWLLLRSPLNDTDELEQDPIMQTGGGGIPR